MKIQKVASLCKTRHHISIVDHQLPGELRQYIGDGTGLYFTGNLPEVDDQSVFSVFDVPGKLQEKYYVEEITAVMLPYSLIDHLDQDKMVERAGVDLMIGGDCFIPLYTSRGVRLLAAKYLAPFDDCDADHPITIWERIGRNNELYLLIRVGFYLNAVIEPLAVPEVTRVALNALTEAVNRIPADPETGEVEADS